MAFYMPPTLQGPEGSLQIYVVFGVLDITFEEEIL